MHYIQFSDRTFKGQRIVAFLGSDAPSDPEMTKQKVIPLFEGSEENQKLKELGEQKKKLMNDQRALLCDFNANTNKQTHRWAGIPGRDKMIQAEYGEIGNKLNELEKEIQQQSRICDRKLMQLRVENAVYVAPRNAVLIDDEDLKKWDGLTSKRKLGQHILENGDFVTDEELESERISNLSPEAKEQERQAKENQLVAASIRMRNELEIKGDKNALEKAQEWYQSELEKIGEQYTR
jgi:hypothetical protein